MLEPDDPVVFVTARGQHDDRYCVRLAEPPADLESVQPGKHQVENDEVGGPLGRELKRCKPITGGLDVETLPLQVTRHHLGNRFVVVYYEDSLSHLDHHGVRTSTRRARSSCACLRQLA